MRFPPILYRFYFCGDSGYCPAFQQIGAELGPFDVAALPIGGYLALYSNVRSFSEHQLS